MVFYERWIMLDVYGFHNVSDMLKSGIYALVHKGKVVYVGKSKYMLTRVYQHRCNWGRSLKGNLPSWAPVKGMLFDGIFVRPCSLDIIDELEYEMINLYKPKYNVQLKEPTKVTEVRIGNVVLTLAQPNRKPEPFERRI